MGGDAVGTLNQFLRLFFALVLTWRYDLAAPNVHNPAEGTSFVGSAPIAGRRRAFRLLAS